MVFTLCTGILLITYKSIKDMAPEYLCELVSIRMSSLGSSSQILLQVPVSRLKSSGDCAFSVATTTLWNRLPANIRNASSLGNFKSLLKTHLCSRSLSQINNYYLLNLLQYFYRHIIWGIIVQRIGIVPADKGALLNIHYFYYYYY